MFCKKAKELQAEVERLRKLVERLEKMVEMDIEERQELRRLCSQQTAGQNIAERPPIYIRQPTAT